MANKRETGTGGAGKSDDSAQPNFEASLAELEGVVRSLEDGQIGLDEALSRYEQGIRLLKHCRQALQAAERKVLLLTGVDADGNPLTEAFEDSATSLEEKRETRSRRRSRGENLAGGDAAKEARETTDPNEERQRGLF